MKKLRDELGAFHWEEISFSLRPSISGTVPKKERRKKRKGRRERSFKRTLRTYFP